MRAKGGLDDTEPAEIDSHANHNGAAIYANMARLQITGTDNYSQAWRIISHLLDDLHRPNT